MNSTLIAVAILLAVPAPKDEPKKESPSIIGQWIFDSVTHDGNVAKLEPGSTWTFGKDGKLLSKNHKDDSGQKADYKLDPAQIPGHLDLTGLRARGFTDDMYGIYKIEGEMLIISITRLKAGIAVGWSQGLKVRYCLLNVVQGSTGYGARLAKGLGLG